MQMTMGISMQMQMRQVCSVCGQDIAGFSDRGARVGMTEALLSYGSPKCYRICCCCLRRVAPTVYSDPTYVHQWDEWVQQHWIPVHNAAWGSG